MKTINFYEYDELSPEAKAKAIQNAREGWERQQLEWENEDYENALERFEDALDVKVYEWKVDYVHFYYKFELPDYLKDENGEPLSGKLLYRALNNYVFYKLHEPRVYSRNGKGKRTSKLLYHKLPNLTGYWQDDLFLPPILRAERQYVKDNYDAFDLIKACLDKFFDAWKKAIIDILFTETPEWADEIEMYIYDNEMFFYQNGTIYNEYEKCKC